MRFAHPKPVLAKLIERIAKFLQKEAAERMKAKAARRKEIACEL